MARVVAASDLNLAQPLLIGQRQTSLRTCHTPRQAQDRMRYSGAQSTSCH